MSISIAFPAVFPLKKHSKVTFGNQENLESQDSQPVQPVPPADERIEKLPLVLQYLLKKPPMKNGYDKMDVMKLPEEHWFHIESATKYRRFIAEKKQIMKGQRWDAVRTNPTAMEGSQELLGKIVEFLLKFHSEHFKQYVGQAGGEIIHNKLTGDVWDLKHPENNPAPYNEPPHSEPIGIAGMLVPDDLWLMHKEQDGKYHLEAASLCLPSGPGLAHKIGLTLKQIHEDVFKLNETLGHSIDNCFDRMQPGQLLWRMNPFIYGTPELARGFMEDEEWLDVTLKTIGERRWLRPEMETFAKMENGDIIFGTHSEVFPFNKLPPIVAGKLVELMRAMAHIFQNHHEMSKREFNTTVKYLERRAAEG